ncbi:DUF1631 domain-containing protein [Stenotrophomonas sp. HITSZ_GD]|uniref:DUF1631 domain-containing protein n=1 Tax=Stenotrophomonas sp. HITSZ_GD TaxID=3037248 RepID=UPI00240DB7B8|nr:DUF1631 domain-containing protein [Stenotrophomonas sp. HITSZ_GD]MDG2526822.1 DUF1631 domain-containing protein [Stenotrophomonas sp. HITSZ_GD]
MVTSASSSSTHVHGPLAQAPVSARARRLLEALYTQYAQGLADPLKLTLVTLERELFSHAERARNSQIQADLYAEMQRLRERGERFAPRFLEALQQELASLCEPRRSSAPSQDTGNSQAFHALTLVEDTEIDRDIVLNEIARREASRCNTQLQLLGQRFGVLAAAPAFEPEHVPLGPHAACRVLREAGDVLGLALDTQLMLYRVFERQGLERYLELIERANILLAHEGVLPGLVYLPYLAKPNAPRRGARPPGQERGADTAAAPAQAAQAGTPGRGGQAHAQRPLTSWSGQAPQAAWGSAMLGDGRADVLPAAGGHLADPGQGSANDDRFAPALTALHDMLGSARQQPGFTQAGSKPGVARPSSAGVPVQAQALHQTLGTLQSRTPVGEGAAHGPRSIADVQQELLRMLRAEHGPQAGLSAQDTDTFDLLGLLYNEIDREVRGGTSAAELLVRLQVPVVRAALQDRAFFVRDQHPARELLNAVAESGATWLAEDDTDPQLLLKLGSAVDKVVTEYQGDEAVFEAANQEIQTHYRAQARKAEVAERRHVEAARGKERLEMAKRLAGDSIEHVCAERAPPKFVQTLLKQAWSDVLTLTLLRQGEQSEEWAERQQATDRIAEVTCQPAGGPPDIALGGEVESALLQVGYHRDEAGAIARRLSTPGGEDDVTSRTELTAKLKARSRLGEGEGEAARKPAPPTRSASEESHYRALRTLPFGTWFEFVTNQQGDVRRQRLSWYSLITDNALFVNPRGQKIGEQSLDSLARLMASGQARIVTEEKGRLIDRAWQATVRALRSLTGGGRAAQEQPA